MQGYTMEHHTQRRDPKGGSREFVVLEDSLTPFQNVSETHYFFVKDKRVKALDWTWGSVGG